MMEQQQIITQIYSAFNSRDIDSVFKFFSPGVVWPNGWEGGYVHGHDEVRMYWMRQWKEIDPNVTPVNFTPLPNGLLQVDVRQLVKDMQGNLMADSMVKHTYEFDGGLIKKMIIDK